jgi:hypothetical protein
MQTAIPAAAIPNVGIVVAKDAVAKDKAEDSNRAASKTATPVPCLDMPAILGASAAPTSLAAMLKQAAIQAATIILPEAEVPTGMLMPNVNRHVISYQSPNFYFTGTQSFLII